MEISDEIVNNGLMAIGGCRKCSKTFSDRLELIHHFVDHFPSIFYTFENLNQNDSSFFAHLTELLNVDKNEPKKETKIVKSTKVKNLLDDKTPTSSNYDMCPKCCLTFSSKKSFNLHLKTHASDVG